MGSCFSKKTLNSSSSPSPLPDPPLQIYSNVDPEKKKEVFVIKHRPSHELDGCSGEERIAGDNTSGENVVGLVVPVPTRTSSCTKEELDAILIQCGRLSRSSTGKAELSCSGGSCDNACVPQRDRKCSASKGSYDFDEIVADDVDSDEGIVEIIRRRRESRSANSSPNGRRRRRTPSRERDPQQRSGSRERGGGGRRVSRSPGKRLESPNGSFNGVSSSTSSLNGNNSNNNGRPVKMVSVPATVSSLAIDRNGGGGMVEPPSVAAVRRIQVKRTVGAASPRSHSPAKTNFKVFNNNQQQQQQLILSRSNSRKAEQSPYRRNPLFEFDTNVIESEQPTDKANIMHQDAMQNPGVDNWNNNKAVGLGTHYGGSTNRSTNEKAKELQPMSRNFAVTTMMPSCTESLKFPTRTRSSRLSRDLDVDPATWSNPNPSYTALLLEDIHNFHQKTAPTPAYSVPPCGQRGFDNKDLVMESKMVVGDDLMEPSFDKYVTVRRGAAEEGEDVEEQESSGSNSFVGGQQHWLSSSSWEPNSADSTDCYTSSRTYTRENDSSPLGFQRHGFSDSGHNVDERDRRLSRNKRISDNQRTGIGRGRVGSGRVFYSMPTTAASAST